MLVAGGGVGGVGPGIGGRGRVPVWAEADMGAMGRAARIARKTVTEKFLFKTIPRLGQVCITLARKLDRKYVYFVT